MVYSLREQVFIDNANVYASWGRVFRSGGFNSIGTLATIDYWYNTGFGGPDELVGSNLVITEEYPKEVPDSWEIGFKSQWANNRFRANGGYINTTIDNNRFLISSPDYSGLMRVVTVIDKLENSGFEADFDWALIDTLRLYGNLGLMDSEIRKNTSRPLSVGN